MTVDPKYIRTKSDQVAVEQDCYFSLAAAEKVIKFIEKYCVLSMDPWAGRKIVLLPWQIELIHQAYGWMNKDGSRRFKEIGLWIPKKNGKSTLVSALLSYHLIEYKGSKLRCIAGSVEQAKIVFDETAQMIRLGPLGEYVGRHKKFWIRDTAKRIIYTDRHGFVSDLHVLSGSPESKSGGNYNVLIADELAEWNGTSAELIWKRLKSCTAARRNAFKIILSTPQFNRESLGFHKWSYTKSVLDGDIIDTTFLAFLYGVPDDAECICGKCADKLKGWRCPSWWRKCNPSVDTTFPMKDLHDEYTEVLNTPSAEAGFRTLRLGQWVGSINQFIPSNIWARCKEDFKEEDLWGSEAVGAIDLARRHDLACWLILVKKDDLYFLLPRFFIPEKFAAMKCKRDRVPYDLWERLGMVTYTSGSNISYEDIRDRVMEDDENFRFQEIRYDPCFMEETRQILENAGMYMVEVPPYKDHMSEPTAMFERLILDKRIRHNDNLCMNWCVENCAVKTDAEDRIMIDKKRCNSRIDGATAAIIALSYFYSTEPAYVMPTLL